LISDSEAEGSDYFPSDVSLSDQEDLEDVLVEYGRQLLDDPSTYDPDDPKGKRRER
jgi:hypothetical protein